MLFGAGEGPLDAPEMSSWPDLELLCSVLVMSVCWRQAQVSGGFPCEIPVCSAMVAFIARSWPTSAPMSMY